MQLEIGAGQLCEAFERVPYHRGVQFGRLFERKRRNEAGFDAARDGRLGEQNDDGPLGKIVD